MGRARLPFNARRCVTPIVCAAIVVVGLAVGAVVPAMWELLPGAVRDGVVARFLWGVLVVYWAALVGSVVVGSILAFVVIRARRAGLKRPTAARLLLLCTSSLLGVVLIETGSAAWLEWAHRFPVLPARFPASRSDEIHIAVIGGSSAKGQPYQDWLSIGEIVAWKLRAALPARSVIADVLAREGATLEEMHQKLEGIKQRPDVLIIYSGHNEFQARFPWDQDAGRMAGPLPYALNVVMGDGLGSPLFRLVSETLGKYRLMAPPRMVHRGPVEPPIVRRAERERLLDEFGRRIEAIVAWCERIGTLPVLVIPVDNESGFEPNRSVLPPSISSDERQAFVRDWLAACSSESRSEPAQAIATYRRLIARYPQFAEAHFRLARLLERSGRYLEAAGDFRRARDLDGFPQRCPTRFQDAYRRVAARHGCILIEGPAELRALSPHGILDDCLINDAHHPSLRGHVALAEAVLRELRAREVLGWSEGAAPSIDVAECAAHFGIDDQAWAAVCSSVATFYMMTANNRHDPSERLRKAERYRRAAQQIAAGASPVELGVPGIGLPATHAGEMPGHHQAGG